MQFLIMVSSGCSFSGGDESAKTMASSLYARPAPRIQHNAMRISAHSAAPNLDKCACPQCTSKFKRLGTGKIFSLHVNNPESWGLAPDARQIVVWLCSKCVLRNDVKFDRQHHQVLVTSKGTEETSQRIELRQERAAKIA